MDYRSNRKEYIQMKVLAALPNYRQLCGEGLALLASQGVEVVANELGRPLTFEDLKDQVADVDGVVAGVDVWDDRLLALAPKLKGIARFGVGVDNLDLEACRQRGIQVCNCPGVNTNSVAEHALMLILGVTRYLGPCDRAARKGQWPRLMHYELKGKTVGLLGFGAVGRRLTQLLAPFEVTVLAYDKFPNQAAADQLGVTLLPQEEVMARADILSLHTPATPETHHLIRAETIAMMKDGAFLVNTSRGAVTDEAAIAAALASGKLSGYGADVFEHEPPTADGPLFSQENYLCTPHLAAESYENWTQTGLLTAQELLDIFAGKEPPHRLV